MPEIYDPQAWMTELMEAYDHPVRTRPTMPLDPAERLLRAKLVFEEAVEFVEAMGCQVGADIVDDMVKFVVLSTGLPPNLVEAADALADIKVVTYGSDLALGLPAYCLLEEVHRSNMTKLGPDGKPLKNEYGKVTKGPNYEPPQIERVLREHGW